MSTDPWTAETIRSMVRYVADDARIARHCGCSVAEVRSFRRRRKMSESEHLTTRTRPGTIQPPAIPIENERWTMDARRGTDMLAEAIQRACRQPVEPVGDDDERRL